MAAVEARSARPAAEPPASSGRRLNFGSQEIRNLSASRTNATRLADIIHFDQQARGDSLDSRHADVFIAQVHECEGTLAPFSVTNTVDSEVLPPLEFCYTDAIIQSTNVPAAQHPPVLPKGCSCDDDVCDPKHCECRQIGREFDPTWANFAADAFAYKANGFLAEGPRQYPGTTIWECNENCGCSVDCPNRVVSKGRKVWLDLFKTEGKGWGIRSPKALERGTFVLHYAGELLTYDESQERSELYEEMGNLYTYDIDTWWVPRQIYYQPFEDEIVAKAGGGERGAQALLARKREVIGAEDVKREQGITKSEYTDAKEQVDVSSSEAEEIWERFIRDKISSRDEPFTLDAALWGNLSRYFNSSCEPNMATYTVYTSTRDFRRPLLAFFTTRAIEENEELTFCYSGQSQEEAEEMTDAVQRDKAIEELAEKPVGQEVGVNSKLSAIKCLCGTRKCKGLLFRNN